jgi:poly(A) polymerase
MTYDTEGLSGALASAGFSLYLREFSAIDAYLGRDGGPGVRLLTGAGVAELARLFEDLRYPGADMADAALDGEGRTFYFRCADSGEDPPFSAAGLRPPFRLLEVYQDLESRRFYDPRGVYPLLRRIRDGAGPEEALPGGPEFWREGLNPRAERCRALMDGALILARYCPGGGPVEALADLSRNLPEGPAPEKEEQRAFLASLLLSPNPAPGLELLRAGGFIAEIWPELESLGRVNHSKEYHPEGNGWDHTLETFRYRKTATRGTAPARGAPAPGTVCGLRLSLGLLLHDLGKPLAESSGNRRFDGHAELGARAARKFLERLGFDPPFIEDIFYLVKNHMLPAALPRLPLQRTAGIMESPLFPTLMELYRCDEASSFKGLEGYYESSAAYQSWLRCRRNPYRSADGKKLRAAGALSPR